MWLCILCKSLLQSIWQVSLNILGACVAVPSCFMFGALSSTIASMFYRLIGCQFSLVYHVNTRTILYIYFLENDVSCVYLMFNEKGGYTTYVSPLMMAQLIGAAPLYFGRVRRVG